jgi:glycosyltransferase involved in cell wall biosynthesis
MRIIAYVNGNSGPSYHRCIIPLLLMADTDLFITNNLLEEHFEKGCDIFMYNRILPEHAEEKIKELKNKYGFKVCIDVDDYWQLDPHHIMYEYYQVINFAAHQVHHLQNADFIFTTHGRLADEIKTYGNTNIYVLPNAIPKTGQFNIEREPSNLTRLFWQGSITHREDIALLKRPINCLNTISAKIKMVMAGYMEQEDEWYKMVMDYTAETKHQYKLIPGCHVDQYYKSYAHADVCLVPLLNSPFNKHKSNLKVLEAANLGLPVICSPVNPYIDMPVLYAKGTAEWVSNIHRLVASKKRQKEAGAELKEFCDEHFDFNKINKERKQILEHEARK